MPTIKRGEIYWVNVDPTIGAEIKKRRPAVIVSNDINNQYSPLVTILPISSNTSKPYPFEVLIEAGVGGIQVKSLIKANQIRTVDKKRLSGDPLGVIVDADVMQRIEQAIAVHLGF